MTDIIINDIVKNILKLVEITVTAMIVTGVTSSTSTIHQRGTDPAPLPFTPVEGLGATFQDTPVDLRDNIGSSDIESLLYVLVSTRVHVSPSHFLTTRR